MFTTVQCQKLAQSTLARSLARMPNVFEPEVSRRFRDRASRTHENNTFATQCQQKLRADPRGFPGKPR
eukprot:6512822-Pyramimonas_sp.AAC.1